MISFLLFAVINVWQSFLLPLQFISPPILARNSVRGEKPKHRSRVMHQGTLSTHVPNWREGTCVEFRTSRNDFSNAAERREGGTRGGRWRMRKNNDYMKKTKT